MLVDGDRAKIYLSGNFLSDKSCVDLQSTALVIETESFDVRMRGNSLGFGY